MLEVDAIGQHEPEPEPQVRVGYRPHASPNSYARHRLAELYQVELLQRSQVRVEFVRPPIRQGPLLDVADARAAVADGAQDGVVDTRLAQFLAHQQLRFLEQHGPALQYVVLDIPAERAVRVQLSQVVRDAARHGKRSQLVFRLPALQERRGLQVGERPQLHRAGIASVRRPGQHVVHEEANVAAAQHQVDRGLRRFP